MRIRSINLDFGKHGELHSVFLRESFDLRFGTWLLVAELVAGERQNLEALASILLVDLNHPLVVFVSQTSIRCYVYN